MTLVQAGLPSSFPGQPFSDPRIAGAALLGETQATLMRSALSIKAPRQWSLA
jgi:hypothetical protein